MDPMTLIGIGAALGAVLISMLLQGSNPMTLFDIPALILVFGGTAGVALAGVLKGDAKGMISIFKAALTPKPDLAHDAISRLIGLADTARREGLLALEEGVKEITDRFLKTGIELIVDGTDPDQVRSLMEAEIISMQGRHQHGAKILADMGGFAPTLGIIGTVIGLIHVLGSLTSPGALGPLIATAFTATLWGVMSANLFWLPMSNKLKRLSEVEIRNREMILDGILSIQEGLSSRMVEQKLLTYLPPAERELINAKKAA